MIKTCYRHQYNIVCYSILTVNKCCVPAYRSNYKSVKNGVHLIKETVFHLLKSYLWEVNFGRSYRYRKDLPEVDIISTSEHNAGLI